ncbi:MAG: GAF domain-containing sensor histidine kinase [Flavobacterium sp.]
MKDTKTKYRKPKSIIPDNDAERLEKLREYEVLDTFPEEVFDNLGKLAAQVFDTPSAFITFVDKNRVFFKCNISPLQGNEVDRNHSLCSLAILQDHVLMFENTHAIPELLESPYVASEGGIRFYAGAPLKSPEGFNMGTICVVDSVQRDATPEQLEMLSTLAQIVIDKLENRLRYRKSIAAQQNLMNLALHEIRNPLASINLANDIIRAKQRPSEKMAQTIKQSVNRIQNKLSGLLRQAELDATQQLMFEDLSLRELLEHAIANFELLASRKEQKLQLNISNPGLSIYADKLKMTDAMHNLLSNAIKYSYKGSVIKVSAYETDDEIVIEVRDEGQGLDDTDVRLLFKKFAKLSARPTDNESSYGLGLNVTKSIIEMHRGTIEAASEGKDKGTVFIIRLPKHYVAPEF